MGQLTCAKYSIAKYHKYMTYWVSINIPLHTKVFRHIERLRNEDKFPKQYTIQISYHRYLFDYYDSSQNSEMF